MARRLSRDEYTVGWMCALSDEFTAAQELLDEEHQELPPESDDTNIYTLGCIGAIMWSLHVCPQARRVHTLQWQSLSK